MKNDPYLSFSGILLHRETQGAEGHLNHCVFLGSGSLLLLLGPFCSFVRFGADLHSCLCSIIFPCIPVKDSIFKNAELLSASGFSSPLGRQGHPAGTQMLLPVFVLSTQGGQGFPSSCGDIPDNGRGLQPDDL